MGHRPGCTEVADTPEGSIFVELEHSSVGAGAEFLVLLHGRETSREGSLQSRNEI